MRSRSVARFLASGAAAAVVGAFLRSLPSCPSLAGPAQAAGTLPRAVNAEASANAFKKLAPGSVQFGNQGFEGVRNVIQFPLHDDQLGPGG